MVVIEPQLLFGYSFYQQFFQEAAFCQSLRLPPRAQPVQQDHLAIPVM
jgi:hypothetical protein